MDFKPTFYAVPETFSPDFWVVDNVRKREGIASARDVPFFSIDQVKVMLAAQAAGHVIELIVE
jgi:hypothetical protein